MKLYIVGIVASGKTTLARRLSQKLKIPWYELDSIVYPETDSGRRKRTPEEQTEVIRNINRSGSWIIEGTYRKSCSCLLNFADCILFLDMPLWKRKARIFTRFVKQRIGMESCHYRSNFHILKTMYVWTNEFEKNRVQFENMLRSYSEKLMVRTDNKNIEEIAETIKNFKGKNCEEN